MRHLCLLILESRGGNGSQEATVVFVLKVSQRGSKLNAFLTFLVKRCWELLTLLLDGLDTERDKEMVLENACEATVQTWECLVLVGGGGWVPLQFKMSLDLITIKFLQHLLQYLKVAKNPVPIDRWMDRYGMPTHWNTAQPWKVKGACVNLERWCQVKWDKRRDIPCMTPLIWGI